MRRNFGAAAIAAMISAAGPALAADLPVKAPAPVYSWTGFYLGADIGGYGAGQSATTNPFPSPGFGAPPILVAGVPGFGNLPTTHDLGGAGALGAIHAGYNWQVSNWVVGLEGDVAVIHRSVTDIETVFETFAPAPAFNMQVTANSQWLAVDARPCRLDWWVLVALRDRWCCVDFDILHGERNRIDFRARRVAAASPQASTSTKPRPAGWWAPASSGCSLRTGS